MAGGGAVDESHVGTVRVGRGRRGRRFGSEAGRSGTATVAGSVSTMSRRGEAGAAYSLIMAIEVACCCFSVEGES